MSRIENLKAKVAKLPTEPGVYMMLDKAQRTIYVGKAKSLKKRVGSYFQKKEHQRPLTRMLVERIHDIKFIATSNEIEALFVERNLIRKEKPRYNVFLKDDKDYLCLRLSVDHSFPRLTVVRRPKPDGAAYFGPYASAWAARKMARYLYKLFPLRSCSDKVLNNRSRPCILYQINLCTAPCVDKISKQDYDVLVEQMRDFLKGGGKKLIKDLHAEMQAAADSLDYDKAALIRDRIKAIEMSMRQQNVVFHDLRDMDAVGIALQDEHMALAIVTIRKGQVIGKRQVICSLVDDEHLDSIVESLLAQHYLESVPFVPPTILLPKPMPGAKALEEAFSKKAERRIALVVPKRGDRLRLVGLAVSNAELNLKETLTKQLQRHRIAHKLAEKLHLEKPPSRLEAYDISNIQGTDAVGSQVTFIDGKPSKANYRRYKIRTIEGANDFAMLHEIMLRRFKKDRSQPDPDLILIDGGKGQLSAAKAALDELAVDLPLASIAKIPDNAEVKGIVTDRIFLPGRKNPVHFKPDDSALKLLQHMRDEAHRFAISFHRQSKRKRDLTSEIDRIPGVGEKRRQRLLKHFGSVAKIKKASLAALEEILPTAVAAKVYEFFHAKP